MKCSTVQELLARDSRWTKHAIARTAKGRECKPLSTHAVQFCLLGALLRVYPDVRKRGPVLVRLYAELRARGWSDAFMFNNSPSTTAQDVRTLVAAARV